MTLRFRVSPSRPMGMVVIYSPNYFCLTTVNFVSPAWIVLIPISWAQQTVVQTACQVCDAYHRTESFQHLVRQGLYPHFIDTNALR